MADEDTFLDEDVAQGGDVELGNKPGVVSALLLKVLKWAAIGIAGVLVIASVSYLTSSLMGRGSRPATVPVVSEEYQAQTKELTYVEGVFDDIRTRTADETPFTVIAKFALGHEEGADRVNAEIVRRNQKIQDVIRSYFTQKTAAEVGPRNESIVKQELLIRVNSILNEGKIEDVIFLEYNVIPL